MPSKMVRFTVSLSIADGKLEEFGKIAEAMLAATRREPGALGYDWYLSSDRRHCRLLETYADADAVVAHLTGPVVQEAVPKLPAVAFEVYGDPGPKASAMLAGFGAVIFSPWHVFWKPRSDATRHFFSPEKGVSSGRTCSKHNTQGSEG
jgi:quinol monooxygenase YgiN